VFHDNSVGAGVGVGVSVGSGAGAVVDATVVVGASVVVTAVVVGAVVDDIRVVWVGDALVQADISIIAVIIRDTVSQSIIFFFILVSCVKFPLSDGLVFWLTF